MDKELIFFNALFRITPCVHFDFTLKEIHLHAKNHNSNSLQDNEG
jgi:hypothetical protein